MSNADKGREVPARRPTSADVAKRANVSRATVSYVLNNTSSQTISTKTREEVLKAAAELGYRPNLAARNLAAGDSGTVLNVITDPKLGEFGTAIIRQLSKMLTSYGLTQSVIFDEPGSKAVVNAINDVRPVAVVSQAPLSRAAMAALTKAKIPHLNIQSAALSALYLTVGDAQVAHLLSRGHRRIAFAMSDAQDDRWLATARCEAVRAAAASRGLDELLVAELATDGSDARQVVGGWHDAGVDAICAFNDRVALIVQHGVRAADLRCPADLALIGVDADPIGLVANPALTTIAFDEGGLVALSLGVLLQTLGYPPGDSATASTLVSLVQRAST